MARKIGLRSVKGIGCVKPNHLVVFPGSPIALLVYRKTASVRIDLSKDMFIDKDEDPEVQEKLDRMKKSIVSFCRRK